MRPLKRKFKEENSVSNKRKTNNSTYSTNQLYLQHTIDSSISNNLPIKDSC